MDNKYITLVKKLKLWIVILAILNITIISTIGVNMYLAKQKEAETKKSINGVKNFFVYYLQLTDNQQSEFDSISLEYNNRLKEVGFILRSVKERMNTQGIEKDTVAMNKMYEDFLRAQALNRDLTVQFYENIREICNPLQVKKFEEVILKTAISLQPKTTPQ